jgi:hypothetical protein
MWYIYMIVALAVLTFGTRRWGWHLYHIFGRPLFLRKFLGKAKPLTPTYEKRRLNNDYSVFQVFDDGSIISSRIEKPLTVKFYQRYILVANCCDQRSRVEYFKFSHATALCFKYKFCFGRII